MRKIVAMDEKNYDSRKIWFQEIELLSSCLKQQPMCKTRLSSRAV